MNKDEITKLQNEVATLNLRLEEITKSLENLTAEESTKWEPRQGKWFVDAEGITNTAISVDSYRLFGVEFNTEAEAIKASKAFRAYHLQYQLALELNDGWELDWTNSNQYKYVIDKNYNINKYCVSCYSTFDNLGSIYFKDEETAQKAIEIISAGNIHF